jgi:hypothetical protein
MHTKIATHLKSLCQYVGSVKKLRPRWKTFSIALLFVLIEPTLVAEHGAKALAESVHGSAVTALVQLGTISLLVIRDGKFALTVSARVLMFGAAVLLTGSGLMTRLARLVRVLADRIGRFFGE